MSEIVENWSKATKSIRYTVELKDASDVLLGGKAYVAFKMRVSFSWESGDEDCRCSWILHVRERGVDGSVITAQSWTLYDYQFTLVPAWVKSILIRAQPQGMGVVSAS